MSGDIERKDDLEEGSETWVYPAEVRILDSKGMGGGRGIVHYLGVPLPGDDLAEIGISPGEKLGLSRESKEYPGVEINYIVYSLDGSGEMVRQIRGGTESKPTWLISLPYDWVEPQEYPIDPNDEPSFLPLEDGQNVVLELEWDDGVLRLYRTEDYQHRIGAVSAEGSPEIHEMLDFFDLTFGVERDDGEPRSPEELEELREKVKAGRSPEELWGVSVGEKLVIEWDDLTLP